MNQSQTILLTLMTDIIYTASYKSYYFDTIHCSKTSLLYLLRYIYAYT